MNSFKAPILSIVTENGKVAEEMTDILDKTHYGFAQSRASLRLIANFACSNIYGNWVEITTMPWRTTEFPTADLEIRNFAGIQATRVSRIRAYREPRKADESQVKVEVDSADITFIFKNRTFKGKFIHRPFESIIGFLEDGNKRKACKYVRQE